jgi:alpha-L-fucosidase
MTRRAAWLRDAQWGVFCHYLADGASVEHAIELSPDDWNRRIDRFDVEGLARQLSSVGARYFFLTVGQNSGYYCSPNQTYDELVGRNPGRCSRRDLIADLAAALGAKGIRMMVYVNAGGPGNDALALERLGSYKPHVMDREAFVAAANRYVAFQRKWESVVREWSLRWGKGVHGWWVDGCGEPMAGVVYRHDDEPNFKSFADALRAGNPESLVAFNNGVRMPVHSSTPHEDYTSGELAFALQVNTPEFFDDSFKVSGEVNGAQYHVLCYLGQFWGRGAPRFPDELVRGYTRHVIECGGAVTWDVPVSDEGSIPEAFLRQLANLHSAG